VVAGDGALGVDVADVSGDTLSGISKVSWTN